MKKIIIFLFAAIIATGLFIKQQMPEKYIQDASQLSTQEHSLVLVNKETKYSVKPNNLILVPQDVASNIVVNDSYLVDEQLLSPLIAMLEEAKHDGINNFILNSAYRSFEEQQYIFNEKGSNYALPAGYSEHETGLAIDIGSTMGLMGTSEEGKWLANNAHRYGFILRYPEHKENITQISYEPWHFRYVGLPHSVIMYEEDMVLEEYVALVKEKKEMTKKINGIKYKVEYVKDTKYIKNNETFVTVKSFSDGDGIILTSIKL